MTWWADLTVSFGSGWYLFLRIVIRFACCVIFFARIKILYRWCLDVRFFLPFCLRNFLFRMCILVAIARLRNSLSWIIRWFCRWSFSCYSLCCLGFKCLLFLLKLHLGRKFIGALTIIWLLILFIIIGLRLPLPEGRFMTRIAITTSTHVFSTWIYTSEVILDATSETWDHVLIGVISLYLCLVMFKMFNFQVLVQRAFRPLLNAKLVSNFRR